MKLLTIGPLPQGTQRYLYLITLVLIGVGNALSQEAPADRSSGKLSATAAAPPIIHVLEGYIDHSNLNGGVRVVTRAPEIVTTVPFSFGSNSAQRSAGMGGQLTMTERGGIVSGNFFSNAMGTNTANPFWLGIYQNARFVTYVRKDSNPQYYRHYRTISGLMSSQSSNPNSGGVQVNINSGTISTASNTITTPYLEKVQYEVWTVNNAYCSNSAFPQYPGVTYCYIGVNDAYSGALAVYAGALADISGSATADYSVNVEQVYPTVSACGFESSYLPTGGWNASEIVARDFNNDGKQDLAFLNRASSGDSVSVVLGNGSGGFSVAGIIPLNPGSSANYNFAVNDFNSNGKLDIVIPSFESSNFLLWLGDGLGGFSNGGTVAVSSKPIRIVSSDFNSDGLSDVAMLSKPDPNLANTFISVLLGNETGGFQSASSYPASENDYWIELADFNGDSIKDIST